MPLRRQAPPSSVLADATSNEPAHASGAVSIANLTVRTLGARPVTLVEDLSLRVDHRTICGVVGETGAGKTLSVRAILGLLPVGVQATGTLTLGSEMVDLARSGRRRRELLGREMGVVLQNPAGMLDPLIPVGAQLIEGVVRRRMQSRGEAFERAISLLRRVGFPDPPALLSLYPHQLSGGMNQRVAIAMAMMPRPKLLVVDEPTSALDAHLRVEVLELIRAVTREHDSAVILVSHDLALVSHFCDKVAVMYAGRVVEDGEASDVLGTPQHPYTLALLSCSPALSAPSRTPLTVVPGAPPRPGQWHSGCVFAPRCPYVHERCWEERPALCEHDNRRSACHLDPAELEAPAFGKAP
jgi:oligopeptide/dipeptide ABC transporter ATP-binding protein